MKKDWEIKKLGDCCNIQNGYAFDSKFFTTNKNDMPLIRIRDIKRGFSETYYSAEYPKEYIVHKGDFLIGMDGEFNIGEWKSEDALLNQRVCRIVCDETKLLNRYIFYFIPKELKRIEEHTTYTTVKHLSSKQISEMLLPVPPLEEQKRIVKILDEKFAQLETIKINAQTNLQNAKDLFQSQLKKIFNNKDLKKKKLSDLCELISGYAFDSKGYTSNDEDTLLICGDNIMHCSFRWETVKKWPKEQYNDLKRFELKEYDIVLAMDRPWIKSGLKISKITENELPSLLVQRTAAIRTTRKILSEYLYYALQEESFSKYLVDQQTGAGVPHISGKQILNFEVGIPLSPSTRSEDLELRGIVKELDTLSEKVKALQNIYEKMLLDCEELKQSLLAKAFEGNL